MGIFIGVFVLQTSVFSPLPSLLILRKCSEDGGRTLEFLVGMNVLKSDSRHEVKRNESTFQYLL